MPLVICADHLFRLHLVASFPRDNFRMGSSFTTLLVPLFCGSLKPTKNGGTAVRIAANPKTVSLANNNLLFYHQSAP